MFKHLFVFAIISIAAACAPEPKEDPIALALASDAPAIQKVMQNIDTHELQIMLSTIDIKGGEVLFTDYQFQVNDSIYYYPASTVKFPAAVLALEALNKTPSLNVDTSYEISGDSVATTFRSDIVDIFAVSSNTAFNNLYEYLGPNHMNERLTALGIGPVRYAHRLSTANADTLWQRPIHFTNSGTNSFTTPGKSIEPAQALQINKLYKGKGFYKIDSLVTQPMDFSKKNYLPLTSLHNVMKRVIFPEAFPVSQRFDLSEEQQIFLLETMKILPKDAGYNPEQYYDSYVKFFLFGDTKEPMPSHIKIHNKVGYAYGYLTDSAYIIDTQHQMAYILTATIHVNEDQIFNDDVYEYESIGIPFLAELGRQVHQSLLDQQ
ncbi:MAG: serine hydrolase [Gilvibacter sp.]